MIKRRKSTAFRETAASSDLAFILIIYFLVIAGFNINLGFLMNLPEKDSTRLVLRDELMRFEMDSNGRIFYEETELRIVDAEREISAVGFDTLSIDPFDSRDNAAHHVLLGRGIPVIENIANLSLIPVHSFVIGLPNKFRGGSGSPIRLIALTDNQ